MAALVSVRLPGSLALRHGEADARSSADLRAFAGPGTLLSVAGVAAPLALASRAPLRADGFTLAAPWRGADADAAPVSRLPDAVALPGVAWLWTAAAESAAAEDGDASGAAAAPSSLPRLACSAAIIGAGAFAAGDVLLLESSPLSPWLQATLRRRLQVRLRALRPWCR